MNRYALFLLLLACLTAACGPKADQPADTGAEAAKESTAAINEEQLQQHIDLSKRELDLLTQLPLYMNATKDPNIELITDFTGYDLLGRFVSSDAIAAVRRYYALGQVNEGWRIAAAQEDRFTLVKQTDSQRTLCIVELEAVDEKTTITYKLRKLRADEFFKPEDLDVLERKLKQQYQ